MAHTCKIQDPQVFRSKLTRSLSVSIWILLVVSFLRCVSSWQGDMWYFTSFQNVSEWEKLYHSCNVNSSYTHMNISDDEIPFTLSPIALPKSGDAIPVNRSNPNEARVLVFYNNAPPETNSYVVSYGFQKTKECISQPRYDPCLVSPTFGKIRAVTLTAVRTPISRIKLDFTLEPPEKFVTIINGGSTNERKFYEAIFLGNVKGSNGYRSTHTIDGKSYPMEIYMYFVDEVLEVMSSATILVVLVEEQEEDNAQIKPVINAVSYHLYNKERAYLKANHDIVQREQMYDHLKESTFRFQPTAEDPFIPHHNTFPFLLGSSADIETNEAKLREAIETFQTLKSVTYFTKEEFERTFGIQARFADFIILLAQNIAYTSCADYIEVLLNVEHFCPDLLLVVSWIYYVVNRFPKLPPEPQGNYSESYWTEVIPAMIRFKTDLHEFQEFQHSNPNDRTEDKILAIEKFNEKVKMSEANLIQRSNVFALTLSSINLTSRGQPARGFASQVISFRALHSIANVWRLVQSTKKQLDDAMQETVSPFGFHQVWQKLLAQANYTDSVVEKAEILLKNYYDYEKRFEDHELKQRKFKRTGKNGLGENLGLSQAEYEEYENLSPLNQTLKQRFQVSWLIPNGGGYYYYHGSSPVPPCYQAQRVIVFKKPIKMSREQIKTLSVVPSSSDKMRDIRNTLPPIHKLRRSDFPIYFDKRNHQFLREDGFHKNSIFEAQRRREERAKGNSTRTSLPTFLSLLSFLCATKMMNMLSTP